MKAHHQRPRIRGAVALLHMARPNAARGAELRDLLKEVVVDVPEERKTRRKRVDVQAACNSAFYIGESVCESEGQLLCRGGASFPDVVTRDRDRIPLRYMLG